MSTGYYNTSLNQYIVNSTVLEWLRNVLANRLAENASTWIDVYSRYNSGTYNNMNMVRKQCMHFSMRVSSIVRYTVELCACVFTLRAFLH